MVDHPFHQGGLAGGIERLDGEADVVRTISTGERSTQGTSERTPRQKFEKRHRKLGSQVTPDSISTILRPGNFANTPSAIMLPSCDWKA
jgi:hypothetical protein